MKYYFNITYLFGFSFLIPFLSIGQDKTIDKIEMLYDQGNYGKVYRTTVKLQKDSIYASNAPLKLFEALSEYQLSSTKKKYSETNAISNFKTYLSRDTLAEYNVTYGIYIYDLQIGIVNEIRSLNKDGKTKESKLKYEEYSNLFEHNASYEEIISDEPKINTKTPEPTDEENSSESGRKISSSKLQKNIIKEAEKHIGTKYKYGGITPDGFDCSGFTQYVMAKNDIQIPRTSGEQAEKYKTVKEKDAEIGDLVFFGSSKTNINHVGIVSGVEKDKLYMIHASTSKGIMLTEITTNVYWSKKMQFIARIIEK